jgi:hypothetical protein
MNENHLLQGARPHLTSFAVHFDIACAPEQHCSAKYLEKKNEQNLLSWNTRISGDKRLA